MSRYPRLSSYHVLFCVAMSLCLLLCSATKSKHATKSKQDGTNKSKQDYRRGVRDDGESFTGWVDPDTAEKHWMIKSFANGEEYDIVMSDEFEVAGTCNCVHNLSVCLSICCIHACLSFAQVLIHKYTNTQRSHIC